MSDRIKVVPFDPSRHVIRVREVTEGREQFVALESLVEAERPLEAQHEAVAINELRREIEALKSNPVNTADLERRIVKMFEDFTQPLSFTQETMAVLTDLTQAVLKLKQDQADTMRRVDVMAAAMVKVGDKLGV
jgi:hypothetical protein